MGHNPRRAAVSRTRLAVAVVLLLPPAAAACLWDYDTLAQERGRFPTVLELITGKYLRHSPEFYEWRAADRRKRLAADPSNLSLHDDLVVALDRLGRYDQALAAVETAARLRPGRYETEANWGTVLLHAGRLEEGLAHIDAAVRINPDAHFGREVYQQKLVRWVIDARMAGRTLPVARPAAAS
jgi:tetratricopeptide (TPR) repeat protein